MKKKVLLIVVLVAMMVLSSCSFGEVKNDQSDQVRALETQNALLAKQIDQIQQNLQDKQGQSEIIGQPESTGQSENTNLPAPSETGSVQVEQAQKEPDQLPTEPVKAGVPIVFDGWQLTVSSEIQMDGKRWGIKVYVKNLTDRNRVFRFTNASVGVSDDVGTVYTYYPKYSSVFVIDCELHYHEVKNLEIRSERTAEIAGKYASCNDADGLNQYNISIPLEAKKLIVTFDDFGPFTGITAVIDL